MASELLTVMVIVLSTLMLVQAIVAAITILKLQGRFSHLVAKTQKATAMAKEQLDNADKGLQQLDSALQNLPAWNESVTSGLETLSESVKKLDSLAGEGISHAKGFVDEASGRSDTFLSDVSKHSYQVHKAVIDPAHQISQVLSSLQENLSKLIFGRRDGHQRREGHEDDQIFI
jgi:uncharacterized phage infection (PIP) family protein YhgE